MSPGPKRFEALTLRERLTIGAVLLLVAGAMAQIKWPNPYVDYYLGPYGALILIVIVVIGLFWFQRNPPGSDWETQDAPFDER